MQANYLVATSFSPSALPNRYVHSFEHDGVEAILLPCFEGWVEYCFKNPPNSLLHCIVKGTKSCLKVVEEEEKGSPLYKCLLH